MKSHESTQKIAQERAAFLEQLRALFDSPAGKPVLAWLHATAGTKSPAYSPGGNATDAIWRDGRKSIVLEIEGNLAQARTEFGKADPATKPQATGGRAARRKGG